MPDDALNQSISVLSHRATVVATMIIKGTSNMNAASLVYNTNKQERLEAQFHLDKGSKFEAWAIEKRVVSLPLSGDVIIPSTQTVASGPLLQLMINAFCGVTRGVIVVKCASGKGKSLAARYLLSKASRGMMFVGSAESGSYSKALSKAVGAPDTVGVAGWLRDLFEAITKRPQPLTWKDKVTNLFRTVSRACINPPVEQDENLNSTSDEQEAQLQRVAPRNVVILDSFDIPGHLDMEGSHGDEDWKLTSGVRDLADALGVLVFVITQEQTIANRLLQLNIWERVWALEGLVERKPDLGEDGKHVNPSWQEIEWDVDQLRQVLRCHGYPNQLVDRVDVNRGDTPRAVLCRADKARGDLERDEPANSASPRNLAV